MSRKKTQPKKVVTPDPIFNSTIIPKLINSIMYDGKKVVAEKIVYEAIEKIKSKTKEEPINVFNEAINNIKPTVEVRSRRVGGATYQVPVDVRPVRRTTLAMKWIVDYCRERGEKDFMLIDVREPNEYDIVSIPGAVLIPKNEFLMGDALTKMPTDKQIVLHCKVGGRSAEVLAAVKGAGFKDAIHVGGGILAWVSQIEPDKPSY